MTNTLLSALPNIGKTVESRLNEIGVFTRTDLQRIGAVKAYQLLCERNSDKHLPVCYYLYSLQGALKDKHWDALSDNEKKRLRIAAGLEK